MTQPLDYRPPTRRRSRRYWPLTIIMLAFSSVLLLIGLSAEAVPFILIPGTIWSYLTWSIIRDIATNGRWAYEVEGLDFRFRRRTDRGWGRIRLDEVKSVFDVQADVLVGREQSPCLEFVFRNGQRLLIDAWVFGWFGDTRAFFKVLEEARPELEIDVRDGDRCPYCDEPLESYDGRRMRRAAEVRRSRCPDCGGSLPRQVPKIPAEGMRLPQDMPSR